ncbi:tryptophan--tRNA ligase [Acetivibrio thermocellus]|jgi:tryptophanyl-tRNA synthetase|uniref:tryptophan--tRNA ligase n=1 Tax=Acetivibrio thermocellus TaxID=1515 RepID=UPI00003C8E7C|nr:tryptophan--tRNA ligase [Acetivibrio thermocellus]CDG35379.1 Tryptophan-tRNA ligase [Acetivibrio thermocellus BC1]ADU74599.1 tryptophanyl-tRNA synthetase [Acetivibrio thermocellus DSM 1313]ANV76292.1 Tryptophan-tRNA ligase, bacterial-type [Acetivibrio thermocellus DSM 2360]UWV45565.1 tryptophan--tRNA ligase [Acetivibrio thermocellus]SOD25056.1 tryptophanyl-tRNA synthetase [Acetivibrio thermocellus]
MIRFIIRECEVLVKKGTILSGMRPTGALHLGNYFGALENWVKLQDEYECYFFVADWHALTTGYEDTSQIKNNINDLVIDWLSAGLDPEKCVIFLQSSIKEHAELHLLFSMTTPLSWLLRCPTYKDQINQLKDKNITTYGFLGYPCLQAADILIYKAGFVPVGEDQLPHLELTREIARRFNYLFGEVFPEPQAILTKAKVLPGTDGRKMSKSYGNTIALSDSPDTIRKKVSSMITDPARIRKDDPGHPEVCTVFSFHKVFNENEVPEIEQHCRGGKIGCVQCKKNLADKMVEHLEPIYEKRQKIVENPSIVKEILADGNEKARKVAQKTLEEVRKAMKIDFI